MGSSGPWVASWAEAAAGIAKAIAAARQSSSIFILSPSGRDYVQKATIRESRKRLNSIFNVWLLARERCASNANGVSQIVGVGLTRRGRVAGDREQFRGVSTGGGGIGRSRIGRGGTFGAAFAHRGEIQPVGGQRCTVERPPRPAAPIGLAARLEVLFRHLQAAHPRPVAI